jgi:hypothetical protein
MERPRAGCARGLSLFSFYHALSMFSGDSFVKVLIIMGIYFLNACDCCFLWIAFGGMRFLYGKALVWQNSWWGVYF